MTWHMKGPLILVIESTSMALCLSDGFPLTHYRPEEAVGRVGLQHPFCLYKALNRED